MTDRRSGITDVVAQAQHEGFVGAAPLDQTLRHARAFAQAVETTPTSFVDLGSGGGLPGLVLADVWPDAEAYLVESNARRCGFLRDAVVTLDLADRVTVLQVRAELLGRDTAHRAAHPLVVARGFGSPAVTAECAAPLLQVGGHLVVSEPPERSDDRWPVAGLAQLGLRPDQAYSSPFNYQRMVQTRVCPDRYPRRVGVPGKRPLF